MQEESSPAVPMAPVQRSWLDYLEPWHEQGGGLEGGWSLEEVSSERW